MSAWTDERLDTLERVALSWSSSDYVHGETPHLIVAYRAQQERIVALTEAARAAHDASSEIKHHLMYQGIPCALVPLSEWEALVALVEGGVA